MSSYPTVVTRKGQITVPVEVRRALGLREGDIVTVSLDGDSARLVPTGNFAERTAGIFRLATPSLSVDELRQAGEAAISESSLERAAEH
jgi:AbrB family looped-hinge helix DNA binding protein